MSDTPSDQGTPSAPETPPSAPEIPPGAPGPWSGQAPPPPPLPAAPEPAAAPPVPGDIDRHHRRERGRGGVAAGIMLVVIGALLLAAQFSSNVSFWSLWPLIIVAAGVVQAVTPGDEGWGVNRFFDGLVTVAIGIVLLGCSTGYLPWSVWFRVIVLWPVLLISVGIAIIGRAIGQRWLGAIGSMLVIAALAWAAVGTYQQSPVVSPIPFIPAGQTHTLQFAEPVNGVQTATLKFGVGAANVKLGAGSDLVRVDASSPWGQPTASVERSGSSATVNIGLDDRGPAIPLGNGESRVDVSLARDVTWSGNVSSGATDMTLDASELKLARLDISTGASDTELKLGPSRAVEGAPAGGVVTFQSGAASFKLHVPTSAQVRLHITGALLGTQTGGLVATQGVYETPGFDSAKPFWDITIKAAAGSFQLTRY